MKNYLFVILLFSFFLVGTTVSAQQGSYKNKTKKSQFYGNQRLHQPLFKWVTGPHQRHGIQLSFGPTYTFTRMNPVAGEVPLNGDSPFSYSHEAKSRIGIFAEIGMVHITKRPRKFIQYYDWAIGYKHIGGGELFESGLYNRDTLIGNLAGEGEFYNGYLYGRFTAHNVFQINPYTFLDNGLGINLDYAMVGMNKSYEGAHLPQTQQFQGNLLGQLHYDIGFGFKPKEGFFIIPGVQLPLLTAYEWNRGTPSIHWFSSKYYPVLFKVKFVWLFRKDPNRCPPVETNEEDRKRANEYMNR
jgi:hypothetical protein